MSHISHFTPEGVADEIIELCLNFGDKDYIGEEVSQIQHMTQCAVLASKSGYSNEVILAAFLHDIGHLCEYVMPTSRMNKLGAEDHELLGYTFLIERGFSEKVCKMVASHVNAKRYLTYRDPVYYDLLSAASKKTLELQGGKMSPDEALAFEMDPLHQIYIQIRRWDDQAKNPSITPIDVNTFRSLIIEHLSATLDVACE